LDHGLYFDIDPELRVNYGKLWLSLIAPASPSTNADRRKYAELVGNISPDLVGVCLTTFAIHVDPFLVQYPVFEAALTGRATLEGAWGDDPEELSRRRASSVIDLTPQSEEEMEAIRHAVISREGLLLSVFDVLRRVPRRVLMVLKLNDLTR
jgi:aarF domain-containing kinase